MAARNSKDVDLLAEAFALLAERGWRGFSPTELARRTDRTLAQVQELLPCRAALLGRLARRVDAQMLDLKAAELDGLSPRERVFELIMRRFDAMAPFKAGLRVLARQAPGDLGLLGAAACNLRRLSGSLLDAAETGEPALAQAIGRKVLGAIYGRVFQVWLDDDTPDLARTLAELDRRLQQGERLAHLARRWRPGRDDAAGDPARA
ncbi:MAG: hypothetical protein U1E17_10865 [Geminicoccaceae bacterium]